jgi:hypothetical protein
MRESSGGVSSDAGAPKPGEDEPSNGDGKADAVADVLAALPAGMLSSLAGPYR